MAGGSEFQVRDAAVLNDRLARTAVGRTTIDCCVRWVGLTCGLGCFGSCMDQEFRVFSGLG